MNILDDEVFAVIMALVVVGSVFAVANIVRPEVTEPFTAIGLLNEECVIGDYPKNVFVGQNVSLCIFLHNHMGYPILAQVRFKIGTNDTIPTNTTPSPQPTITNFTFILGHDENITKKISVIIAANESMIGKRIALIFELWQYDTDRDTWVYTGRWTHLYVLLSEAPIP